MELGGYGTRAVKAMAACKRFKLVGVISGKPSKITTWQSAHSQQGYRFLSILDIEKLVELVKK